MTRGSVVLGEPDLDVRTPRLPVGAVIALAIVAVTAAAATGTLATHGASRLELVAPLASLLALGLVALGCYRFEWFVLCVLAVRTVADVTKAQPAGARVASVVSSSPDAVSSGPAASALAVLFIVVSSVWLLSQYRSRGTTSRLTPADGAFALFTAACLLSVVSAVNRTASITEVARIVAAVLMFVVLQRLLTNMQQVRRVLAVCAASFVAPVAVGALQAVSGTGRFASGGVSRVIGTFLHPNTFGFFLDMFIVMGVAVFRHCPKRTQRALVVGIGACAGLLLLTYSRGAWVALVLGLAMVGLLQSRKIFLWMGAAAVGSLVLVSSVLARVVGATSTNTTAGQSDSLIWRFKYWSQIWDLNHNNPITGIGLKGTKFLTDQSKAPHNDFLRAYVETGVLGLLGYLVVVAALIGIARRAVRATTGGLERGVAVGFAGVLIAYLIDSLGDNLMSEVLVLWYFYAAAACAYAVTRIAAATTDFDAAVFDALDVGAVETGSEAGRRNVGASA